jgi:chemotaxis protein MotB
MGAPAEIKKAKRKPKEDTWMATFSDLSLNLMCFFALLLSMSTMNKSKVDVMVDNMKGADEVVKVRNLKNLKEMLQSEIRKRKELREAVDVRLDMDGLAVEFKSGVLFSSGSADTNPQTKAMVKEVLKIIASAEKKYVFNLEGHTDDAPTNGPKFRSNWELSSARGLTLLNEFKSLGVYEDRMSVQAFAHTKPKVEFKGKKGKDLENARAQNRRVVIRVR